ncbi:uncharacterized protein LOC143691649 [Tamandua tetradactyla]|uniref:uncharacterized protein LOC143691649 n=1 Tax=Tamandua tetradactyla TaxID=48850 RepID=UPI0040546C16
MYTGQCETGKEIPTLIESPCLHGVAAFQLPGPWLYHEKEFECTAQIEQVGKKVIRYTCKRTCEHSHKEVRKMRGNRQCETICLYRLALLILPPPFLDQGFLLISSPLPSLKGGAWW